MSTSPAPRLTTTHASIVGHSNNASSAAAFSGTFLPPRIPSSAVTSNFALLSWMRLLSALAENPPKTTECGAPMRAHASMAIASSGTIGR